MLSHLGYADQTTRLAHDLYLLYMKQQTISMPSDEKTFQEGTQTNEA